MTNLIQACSNGHIDEVKSILNKCDIEIYKQIEAALYYSCYYNRINIIEYLLEYSEINKFKINLRINSIIKGFCVEGNLDIIKRLIKYVENNNIKLNLHLYNEYSFRVVCINGHASCAKYILDYYYKHNEYIDQYIWNEHIPYIFQEACKLNYIDIVKLLIDHIKHSCNNLRIRLKKCIINPNSVQNRHYKILKYMYITKNIIKITNKYMMNNNLFDNIEFRNVYYAEHNLDYILIF